MSEPHGLANDYPDPGDAYALQEILRGAIETDAKPTKSRWVEPYALLPKTGLADAPRFPVKVLGPLWQTWVERPARAANALVNYRDQASHVSERVV